MTTPEVTQLLQKWSDGNKAALDSLTPVVYDELRRLAAIYLHRERSDHTLQATAVVHEAYMRLVDQRSVRWQNRAHFFGIAAQMIRRILVDHARGVRAAKRGSGAVALSLDEALGVSEKRETAEVLGVSESTVKRDWVSAKAWLFRELSKAQAKPAGS
jgi:RNA polymerase sigma factor (TIGR02999 family)